MTEGIRGAAELQALCERRRWRYCFIGGLAVLRWGEPRETVDVDLTQWTGFAGDDEFIHALSVASNRDEPTRSSSPG